MFYYFSFLRKKYLRKFKPHISFSREVLRRKWQPISLFNVICIINCLWGLILVYPVCVWVCLCNANTKMNFPQNKVDFFKSQSFGRISLSWMFFLLWVSLACPLVLLSCIFCKLVAMITFLCFPHIVPLFATLWHHSYSILLTCVNFHFYLATNWNIDTLIIINKYMSW